MIVLALATAALAACGGSSPEQQIRDVVNHFTVDVGQNQLSAACRLTTGQLAAACSSLPPGHLASFTSLTISKVVVSGSSATVAFSGSSEVMSLARTGSGWRISSA